MNEKDKYTELIDRVKAFQPNMPDSQSSIGHIMQSIEKVSQKKIPNKMLIIVSRISSIAAAFLILLFLFEQFTAPNKKDFTSSKQIPESIFYISEKNNMEKPATMSDFNRLLSLKKERQKKQRDFYSNSSSNTIIYQYENY